MKTISVDLRERILAAYDAGEGTRREIAERFMVSEGMVKKLLQQRRRTGDIAPRHQYSGRKPMLTQEQRQRLKELVQQQPDLTLEELREALGVKCSLTTIHKALKRLRLNYKKNA
jgi:transposase